MNLKHIIFLIIFCLIFAAMSVGSALSESYTYDEPLHLQEGIAALTKHTFDVDPLNPPLIRELAVLQGSTLQQARRVILMLSAALMVAVFFVTKKYFGVPAALFALVLFTFEPNILAHSHYVTLDMGFTLFFFLCWIACVKFLQKGSLRSALVFGLTLGLAMASKVSAVMYMGASGVVYAFFRHSGQGPGIQKVREVHWIPTFAGMTMTALFVVWGAYFFTTDVVIKEREDATRVSSRIIAFVKDKHIPFLASVVMFGKTQKIPLGQYLALAKNTVIYARQPKSVFFLGEAFEKSRWYFMPVNVMLKTPLPLLILFLIGIIRGRKNKHLVIFLAPVIGIFAFASFSGISPWVRYVLPIYPFMIIIAATTITTFKRLPAKWYLLFLVVWYVIGTMREYPHFLSYANEIIQPAKRYEAFYDVNIEWGEKLPAIARFVKDNPDKTIYLSYFGTDDGDQYGLVSDIPWETYKFVGVCAFHKINDGSGETVRLISASNWYYCGYNKQEEFKEDEIAAVYEKTFLVFKENPRQIE